jgi:hypothetical protein
MSIESSLWAEGNGLALALFPTVPGGISGPTQIVSLTTTSADFTQPDPGVTVTASFASVVPLITNGVVAIGLGGPYRIQSVDRGANTAVLMRDPMGGDCGETGITVPSGSSVTISVQISFVSLLSIPIAETTGSFTQPASGSVLVPISNPAALVAGGTITIPGGGPYTVVSIDSRGETATLTPLSTLPNSAAAGTVIGAVSPIWFSSVWDISPANQAAIAAKLGGAFFTVFYTQGSSS